MTAAERRNLHARVSGVLVDEVHGQFLHLYAAAVSLTEKHPEQVNNELRNALTHLSRAVAAEELPQAEAEIGRAMAHLERAKRDAVKVAVIELRNRIADACADIQLLNGYIAPGFVLRRNDIAKKRKDIVKDEARGVHVINSFVELYLEADALHDELLAVLADGGRRRKRWMYQLLAWRKAFLGVLVGIAISVVGAAVFVTFAPDPLAFANAVRVRLGVPKIEPARPPPSANTPSTVVTPGGAAPTT